MTDETSAYRGFLPAELIVGLAEEYSLGAPDSVRPGGGTASPKAILGYGGRRFLLRRRRAEFCPENRVRFDHAFIWHLARAGLPVATPLTARSGRTYVVRGEHAYEIVPYIEGLEVADQASGDRMRSAARMLGRLHEASRSFSPPAHKDLGRDLFLPRYLHLLEAELERSRGQDARPRRVAELMLGKAKEAIAETERLRPDDVAPIVVHGDYTPANVLFRGPEVGGVFDFDWATRTNRTWDLARGIAFFAFRRKAPLDPDDIVSLTEAQTPDVARAGAFLRAYEEVAPRLDVAERRILPLFIRETLLCMRVAGMRKLPPDERLGFAVRDMEGLLDWMESGLEAMIEEIAPV